MRTAIVVVALLSLSGASCYVLSRQWQLQNLRTSPHHNLGLCRYRGAGAKGLRASMNLPWGEDGAEIFLGSERKREDDSPDSIFYETPRLVYHADYDCLNRLTALYRELVPAEGVVLDLCSSWVSHLPEDVHYSKVIGMGMNDAELQCNPRLNKYEVQDLNINAHISVEDGSVDAVLIACGIQYLKYPEKVAREAMRVLKRDGIIIISFTENCFKSKATMGFLERDNEGRVGLVLNLLASQGFTNVKFHEEQCLHPTWIGADKLYAVSGQRGKQVQAIKMGAGGMKEPMGVIPVLQTAVSPMMDIGVVEVEQDNIVVWRERFRQLVDEAVSLGIPRAQLVPESLNEVASVEDYKAAMNDIQSIIASRLSSGL